MATSLDPGCPGRKGPWSHRCEPGGRSRQWTAARRWFHAASPGRMNSSGTAYPAGLTGLAALLLANAGLGPIGLDVVAYPLPESLLNQLRGLELVTVLLVVPALLLAAGLGRHERPEGPLVAVGPCAYAAYMFAQYVVGPARTVYSPAVLVHLAVFAASAAL